eukprot:TRINITY_DN100663_c0_g1_i1.p1 TRINITY_DN100663_c0_g1~~TRINITY_DN100663_c0_g1_i1.p1  ORF type:complete len:650 (-),score=78.16 TRINITY_DN100663_c0_g1_i1:13-1962(-)
MGINSLHDSKFDSILREPASKRRCVRGLKPITQKRKPKGRSLHLLLQATRKQLVLEKQRHWTSIRVTSPCTDVSHWDYMSEPQDGVAWCSSWCPCCKRPIDVTAYCSSTSDGEATTADDATSDGQTGPVSTSLPEPAAVSPPAERYAYVTCLWGSNPGFVLGALVLAQALRRSGTKHDLVLLHTDDVPPSSRQLLSRMWKLKEVAYVDAASGLFTAKGGRFDGVFTKLHVLSLTDYDKVLMLDIDLAILKCPDVLFELPAPAALWRGQSDAPDGTRINGRTFFVGDKDVEDVIYAWCQGGGINAGVMLLRPEAHTYERVLREVTADYHPERIPGSGPEQDYISRLYAPSWRHMNVIYNFQLHHVFFSIGSALQRLRYYDERELPGRLAIDPDEICIVHFSGELKMWDREISQLPGEDAEFVDTLLRDCSSYLMTVWADGDICEEEAELNGVRRLEGDLMWEAVNGDPAHTEHVRTVINKGLTQARTTALLAARAWRSDYHALPIQSWGVASLAELLIEIKRPAWPSNAAFAYQQKVEVYWKRADEWYAGVIVAAHEDGSFTIDFDEPGYWGTCCRNVPGDWLRALTEDKAVPAVVAPAPAARRSALAELMVIVAVPALCWLLASFCPMDTQSLVTATQHVATGGQSSSA